MRTEIKSGVRKLNYGGAYLPKPYSHLKMQHMILTLKLHLLHPANGHHANTNELNDQTTNDNRSHGVNSSHSQTRYHQQRRQPYGFASIHTPHLPRRATTTVRDFNWTTNNDGATPLPSTISPSSI